jgi:hypothetical protein
VQQHPRECIKPSSFDFRKVSTSKLIHYISC